MGILSWIIVGLIAGALAKWIIPGDVPGGILATILIGIGGGLVGGGIVSFLGGAGATGLNIWTIVVATLGAVLLLFVYRAVAGRSSV